MSTPGRPPLHALTLNFQRAHDTIPLGVVIAPRDPPGRARAHQAIAMRARPASAQHMRRERGGGRHAIPIPRGRSRAGWRVLRDAASCSTPAAPWCWRSWSIRMRPVAKQRIVSRHYDGGKESQGKIVQYAARALAPQEMGGSVGPPMHVHFEFATRTKMRSVRITNCFLYLRRLAERRQG